MKKRKIIPCNPKLKEFARKPRKDSTALNKFAAEKFVYYHA